MNEWAESIAQKTGTGKQIFFYWGDNSARESTYWVDESNCEYPSCEDNPKTC